MTVNVRIFNEGPRPVQVKAIERIDADTEHEPAHTIQVLKPGDQVTMAVWAERDLRIKEL